MRRGRIGSGSLRSVAVALSSMLMVAALVPAVAAQAPSLLPPVASIDERPMLAPEGWMFATVESRRESRVRLDVVAVSPSGDVRSVATIEDATRDARGRDLETAYQSWDATIATVTTDGFLPLLLDWNDGTVEVPMLVRLFDLLAPDPAGTATDLERTPDWAFAPETVRSGGDGRISMTLGDADGSLTGTTVVIDPLTGTGDELPPPGQGRFSRRADWLADSSGWPARSLRGAGQGVLSADGSFAAAASPLPLLDLARGARQVSAAAVELATWDSGTSQVPVGTSSARSCRQWWTDPPRDDGGPREVWWDRCADQGRLLDIRFDVDGVGVLVLVEHQGRIQLLRRDRPERSVVLASIPAERLADARQHGRDVQVVGLAPGPRPGELLLALQPVDHYRSVFYLSTVEGKLTEVAGGPDDSVAFAGFATPPSDRDVTGLEPIALRPPEVPHPMVAPDGWMLAARATTAEDAASIDLTVVAISPTGETREIAVLHDVNRDNPEWSVHALDGVMVVTTTGVLVMPLSAGDPESGDPVLVRLLDLHDPDRPPIDIEDAPGRVHDWTTLRSSPGGRLSVRIDDEGAFNGRHVIREIDPATGEERLLPYASTIEPAADPLADGEGFPAWQDGRAGILRRVDAVFLRRRPRLVSLARGAAQHATGGFLLSRLVALQRPGATDCMTDAIVSGPVDGPYRVWWDVCRDRGTLLDHRLDVDGRGLLFLVQRGPRIELLRSDRPGEQVRLASVPTRFLGGREPIDRRVGLTALMEGPRPGELLLAFTTARGLWLWSTLEERPVVLSGGGPRSGTWFLGFSVPPGEPR